MIEAGVELVTVSKILGHASIQMTMRYAHPTQESMRNVVNKLGEIFQEPPHRELNEPQRDGFKYTPITQFFNN